MPEIKFDLPNDDQLAAGSLDEVVRNVLWQVCADGPSWDKGYALFAKTFFTSTKGTLAERVSAALDSAIEQMLTGMTDDEVSRRRGMLAQYAAPLRSKFGAAAKGAAAVAKSGEK
jgi:hypothetical protein